MVTPTCSYAIWPKSHDSLYFPFSNIVNIYEKARPLYESGLSLRDIGAKLGVSKNTVRKSLLANGIPLRPSSTEIGPQIWRSLGKKGVKPPYGFCYFEGRVVKHPKEYPVLLQIHRQWKKGMNSNAMAVWLNGKRIPSPKDKSWSWNSVVNIVERFVSHKIVEKGSHLELR